MCAKKVFRSQVTQNERHKFFLCFWQQQRIFVWYLKFDCFVLRPSVPLTREKFKKSEETKKTKNRKKLTLVWAHRSPHSTFSVCLVWQQTPRARSDCVCLSLTVSIKTLSQPIPFARNRIGLHCLAEHTVKHTSGDEDTTHTTHTHTHNEQNRNNLTHAQISCACSFDSERVCVCACVYVCVSQVWGAVSVSEWASSRSVSQRKMTTTHEIHHLKMSRNSPRRARSFFIPRQQSKYMYTCASLCVCACVCWCVCVDACALMRVREWVCEFGTEGVVWRRNWRDDLMVLMMRLMMAVMLLSDVILMNVWVRRFVHSEEEAGRGGSVCERCQCAARWPIFPPDF